jgi:uncharacterized protein YfaS (alpha-2-macroglobulin family)
VLVLAPDAGLEMRWKSATELSVRFQERVRPGAEYVFRLADGVAEKLGVPPDWSARFAALPLLASRSDVWDGNAGYSRRLEREPSIAVRTTYPVRFEDVAKRVSFRAVKSGQRRPASVFFSGDEAVGTFFSVRAREPLPVGETWDLLIEGLSDAGTGTALPHPVVLPAGSTRPLEIDWLGGFNHPLEKPTVRIEFSEPVRWDSVTAESLRVEPPVKGFKARAENRQVILEGEFDRTVRYAVRVTDAVVGQSGFGLAKEERWGVTFRAKRPNLLFPPSTEAFFLSGSGMRFPAVQVNSPEIRWRIAEVPIEKVGVLRDRLREYQADAKDPLSGELVRDARTGWWRQKPTERFIEGFGLRVAAEGRFPATTGDEEVEREMQWTPEGSARGVYLLEAEGRLADGAWIGNRALVYFSDLVVSEISSADRYAVRVSGMADGAPVAGATVRMFSRDPIELGNAVTDETGLAVFANPNFFFDHKLRPTGVGDGSTLVVESAGRRVIEPVRVGYRMYETAPAKELRTAVITDRNVYRPGHTVKVFGIVREAELDRLRVLGARRVRWVVTTADSAEEVASGEAPLSAAGGWEAEWKIPEAIPTGLHQLRAVVDGREDWGGVAMFQVQEYRPPLFTVAAEAEARVEGDASKVRVGSRYFHGAPNAGATVRWRAVWRWIDPESADDYWEGHDSEGEEEAEGGDARPEPKVDVRAFTRTDNASEGAKTPENFAQISGETKLGEDGAVEVVCARPFRDGLGRSRCRVEWSLDVLSPDGQTLSERATQEVQLVPAVSAIRVSEAYGERRGVRVEWGMFDARDGLRPDIEARLELYEVSTKTAKEAVAPFVFRYRNWPVYTKVLEVAVRSLAEIAEEILPVDKAGDYVAVLVPATGIRVSDRTTVTGEERVEFPVENEESFELDAGPKRAYRPGEKAVLATRAPFAGVAWVLVHTDRVMDAFTVRLDGNAGRIEIPIRAEYEPNIAVTVHLMRPLAGGRPAAERVARTRLEVVRPERELAVRTDPKSAKVEPGQPVTGTVRVTSGGRPVKGAELAVFAVDESVLALGQWEEPDVVARFIRPNPAYVSVGMGLSRYAWKPGPVEEFEKGFVIGGGGLGLKGLSPKYARKEFKPLAYWKALVRTDASGSFRYEFTAPDNLTAYRIVAVAHTPDSRFGCGSSKFEVSKPLMIEAALPRFVREDDVFDVRAVVRHTAEAETALTVRCVARGIMIEGESVRQLTARPGEPQVVTFRARVPRGLGEAVVSLDCRPVRGKLSPDAVEVRLPIRPRSVLRRETRMLPAVGGKFSPGTQLPETWKNAEGEFDVILSSSPWIAKLEGLPLMLEYPHGCFEQTASRYLACSFLGELLAYLPEPAERKRRYEALLKTGMRAWDESVLPDGTLPMWRGGDRTSPFVTAMAAWAVHEAAAAGWEVPERLAQRIENGLDVVVRGRLADGQTVSPGTRAFGLMVMGLRGVDGSAYAGVADDLYLVRDRLGDEGRGFLAVALARMKILPERLLQLEREIGQPVAERAFDPDTFSSTNRAEAVQILALAETVKDFWSAPRAEPMRKRLLDLLDSSASLSTQENLWTLVAFKSMHRAGGHGPIGAKALSPRPGAVSPNGASAGWYDADIARIESFVVSGLPAAAECTALVRGNFRELDGETRRDRRGFRIERVMTNLSGADRVGTAAHPVKIGDRLLVTWRVRSERLHHYVALEDGLPAGIETINPDLALIAKTFDLPAPAADERLLNRSHQELRDDVTNLYFDEIRSGPGVYSVLARATAAGVFAWPAAQIVPMYDSRFGGLSAAGVLHVVE